MTPRLPPGYTERDADPEASLQDWVDALGWEAYPRFDPRGVDAEDIESWARDYADRRDVDVHDVYDWMYGYSDSP